MVSEVLEGVSYEYDKSNPETVVRVVDVQAGVVDSRSNKQYGFAAVSQVGANGIAFFATPYSSDTSWLSAFQNNGPNGINFDVAASTGELHTAGNVSIGKMTAATAALDVVGSLKLSGVGLVSTGIGSDDGRLSVGSARTANGNSYIDLIGDTSYSLFGTRLIRQAGPNGITALQHRGTGTFLLTSVDTGSLSLAVNNVERFGASSIGVSFNGSPSVAKPTLPSAATDSTSAIALINAIRTMLISYGLAQ